MTPTGCDRPDFPGCFARPSLFHAYRTPQGHFMTSDMPVVGKMAEIGIRRICLTAGNTLNSLGLPYCPYPPIWLWPGVYDFSPWDKQIADTLAQAPDAELMCVIDLNTPIWLLRKLDKDSFNHLGHVVHNQKWLTWTLDYLRAFLEYTETTYGARFRHYQLCAGSTHEWFDRTRGEAGDDRAAAFRTWCRERGLPEFPIPTIGERHHASHDILRDPEQDRAAIAHWRFSSQSITKAIETFVGAAREMIGADKTLGVFYGYIFSHGVGGTKMLELANTDYEQVFAIPGLDYITVPSGETNTLVGQGGGFLVPLQSVRNAGKVLVLEMDSQTHSSNTKVAPFAEFPRPKWEDVRGTIACLKREFCRCLIEQTSLWWYNIFGDFFVEEEVFAALRQMKEIWDSRHDRPVRSIAEVVLVVDPEGLYYLSGKRGRFVPEALFTQPRELLSVAGVPYTTCSFNDLKTMDLSGVKSLVFCNPFVLSETDLSFLRSTVLCGQRSVLWLYAAGVIDGTRYECSRNRDVCGVEYGAGGLQRQEMDGWTSFYLQNPEELDEAIVRQLLETAGVHIYAAGHSVRANSQLIALHAARFENCRVTMPRTCSEIVDVFAGEAIARNTDSFVLNSNGSETGLFAYA